MKTETLIIAAMAVVLIFHILAQVPSGFGRIEERSREMARFTQKG